MSGPGLPELLRRARAQIQELTGHPAGSVVSASRDDRGWQLVIEVTELERIPASTSILGTYDVLVDEEGQLLEYTRTGRYARNQAGEDE